MIYEMRTYRLRPGTLAQVMARDAKALAVRGRYSRLGAYWHTIHGPLNQVIHVWPYEDLEERARVRAKADRDPDEPPSPVDAILAMESEIMTPAPFMRPLGDRRLGDIYEMRVYDYRPGSMPEVLKRWGEAVPHREKYSPLAACWYTSHGGLNKFYHVWPYKSLADRQRVRAQAMKDPHWPPRAQEFLLRMENRILVPASFSPMR
jgi:hypothetical protein